MISDLVIDRQGKEREQMDKVLPEGWQWVRAGDVIDIRDGTHESPHYFPTGIPLITSKNLKLGQINFSNVNFISYEDHQRFKQRSEVSKGDIIYAMIGTVGNPVIVNTSVEFSIKNLALFKFKNSPFFNEYFYYLLTAPSTLEKINFLTQGGIQKFVSLKVLRNLLVPLPPLAEQKRIVAILNEKMAAIAQARTATLAQLEAAKALPSAYLRQVFNSPEAQTWERKKLGEIAKITAPQIDPKIPNYGALPHINGENIESGTGKLMYLNTASEEGMTSGKYLFDSGDVLYSKLRPYLRKVTVVDFQGLCSADMYPIKVNPIWLNSQFTSWLLLSDEFTDYANEASARSRMPKLNREQLFAWEAPIPPLNEQEKISRKLAEKMSNVKHLSKKIKEQLEAINSLPAAILKQAFNGEL